MSFRTFSRRPFYISICHPEERSYEGSRVHIVDVFEIFRASPQQHVFASLWMTNMFFCIFDKSKILSLAGKNIEVNFIFLARLFVSLPPQSKRNSWYDSLHCRKTLRCQGHCPSVGCQLVAWRIYGRKRIASDLDIWTSLYLEGATRLYSFLEDLESVQLADDSSSFRY